MTRINPPWDQPLINLKTGLVSEPWRPFFAGEASSIGSVVSGVARAQASAAAAQQAATAVQANVDAVQAVTVTYYATVSPLLASAGITGSGTAVTGAVTVTVTGGTGPYTYAWSNVDGDASLIATTSPSAASTTFSAALASGDALYGTKRCTVTDSLAATCVVNVPVSLASSEPSGGGGGGGYHGDWEP